eukprot:scaffold198115_cov33-Tisochrysis_lutea.AAC.2
MGPAGRGPIAGCLCSSSQKLEALNGDPRHAVGDVQLSQSGGARYQDGQRLAGRITQPSVVHPQLPKT